jgi:hypothetical protein
VRFGALLASNHFALFSRSSTASGASDSKYLCWAGFCFHREIMPQTHGQEWSILDSYVSPRLCLSVTAKNLLPGFGVSEGWRGLQVCAVKAPGFGDRRKAMLLDIATLTIRKARW